MKNYARAAITLTRGLGTQVWDDQGRSYLDFTSGIGGERTRPLSPALGGRDPAPGDRAHSY